MRWVGRADLWYNQIPYSPGGWPTNWRIIIWQRFSHRSESSEPHIRLPSPASGRWAPTAFGSEGQQVLISVCHRTGGNRDFILKGCKQNLIYTGTKDKSNSFIGPWTWPTCWSWSVSWGGSRGGGAETYPGDKDTFGRGIREYSLAWTLLAANILGHWHQDLAPPNSL